jgi:hypothetical protein
MPDQLSQNQDSTLSGEIRRMVPTLVLTAAVAFGTSWWNSQLTQNDLRLRLDRLEEKQKETSAAAAEAARTAQLNAIRMAELGVLQNNIAEQVKEIKQDHERNIRR